VKFKKIAICDLAFSSILKRANFSSSGNYYKKLTHVFLHQTSNDAALTNLPLCAVFIKIRLAAVGKKSTFMFILCTAPHFQCGKISAANPRRRRRI
jgi:hypothetical protein